jgi:putative endonuclease
MMTVRRFPTRAIALRAGEVRGTLISMPAKTPAWFVYLLECRGGRIYTGIATDVDRRLAEHRAGRGARFTRAHPPERELARMPCADRPEALRREAAIKRLSPAAKRELADAVASGRASGVASLAAAVETVTSLGKPEPSQ